MLDAQKLTEAEIAAFKKLFPQHVRCLDGATPEGVFSGLLDFGSDTEGKTGHVADLQRRKKSLVGDMRALTELSEKEKRGFEPLENSAWAALDKLIANLEAAIDTVEARNQTTENLGTGRWSGSGLGPGSNAGSGVTSPADKDKFIFRAKEKIVESRPVPTELRGLSIGKMMNIMANGPQKANATERELRSLQEGSDSAGGYTVPTPLLGAFIDLMRSKSVCQQAGAQTVLLTSNKTRMARLVKDPQPAWRKELGQVAESKPSFEGIEFTAQSLAVIVKISRELLADSVNINAVLEEALAKSLALELDRAALFGTGSPPEPLGLVNTPGIKEIHMSGADGGALGSYAPLVFCLQALVQNNAEATAIIANPAIKYWLASLMDDTKQPLRMPDILKPLQFLDTTAVPINRAYGKATDATQILLGDFTQMMVGLRQDLQIEILRENYASTLEVAFLAHLRADVQFAHPSAFVSLDGVVTPTTNLTFI